MHDDVYKFRSLQPRQPSNNQQYTAQVCLNGHTITDSLEAVPERGKKFCPTCGEPTISACPSCSKPIPGIYHYGGTLFSSEYTRPNNCGECGAKFPWTVRILAAMVALTDELNLTEQEKQTIKEKLPDIVQDTPAAKASAHTLKRLLTKAEQAGSEAAGTLRELALELAAKTIVEYLKGP